MAIPTAALPEGTRVKIVEGAFPQDPSLLGRHGTVVSASAYQSQSLGVVLEGESVVRFFTRRELEVVQERLLPPERELAKRRPALP
ncbi:MAG TPA: hypothetical protein VK864_09070 [Longimicrobiales bacterium]|nr:hypothetical protein [Longimicrobiales bacterium]